MKTKGLIIGIVALSLFASCKKRKINKDESLPTITVTEPVLESTVTQDTVMRVTATFVDDVALKSCSMKIGDVNGDDISGFTYTFSEDYVLDTKNLVKDYIMGDNITVPSGLSINEFYIHFTALDQNDNKATLKHKLNY